MSFVRREAREWLARHAELIGSAAILVLGIVLIGRGMLSGLVFWTGLGGLFFIAAMPLLRGAALRLRLSRRRGGPGVVVVDERRVGYFGPIREDGGFIEADNLSRVTVDVARDRAVWTLDTDDGQRLSIPVDAEGASQLQDVFAALPRFPLARALDLIESGREGHFPLWAS
ncbi:MAG: hypothetical protein ACPGID_02070 [Rubricella sp.]